MNEKLSPNVGTANVACPLRTQRKAKALGNTEESFRISRNTFRLQTVVDLRGVGNFRTKHGVSHPPLDLTWTALRNSV